MTPRRLRLIGMARGLRPAPVAALAGRVLAPHRVPVTTAEGTFLVDAFSRLGHTLLEDAVYEPATVRAMKAHLAAGGRFADLGANEGYLSVVASRLVGPGGRVVAVEPQSRMGPVIDANLRANGCQNVTVLEVLVGAEPGHGLLHLAPAANTGASSTKVRSRWARSSQRREVITLEEVLDRAGFATCDLVKIDVEGAEADILAGAESLLRSGRVRAIALELHGPILAAAGSSSAEVEAVLRRCGFALDTGSGAWVRG